MESDLMLSEVPSMALSIEEDIGLVSMLPFGPWFRFPDWMEHGEESVSAWLGWFPYGLAFSMLFRCFLMMERHFRA